MADMKFKFTIQKYQTDAVNSVVRVFTGQPFHNGLKYRMDIGKQKPDVSLFEDDTAYANRPIELNDIELLENIQEVQMENNIQQSGTKLAKHLGRCSLDIEMETGTGKTYVYIKTMFELNKHYGWSKFIVVVPSIAIREGVRKSFETMQDHFMEHYGKKARFFVYNSGNLTDIDNFSSSADLSVMIINVQAFNARGEKARIIRSEQDSFGSRRPIDVIQANRPIIILDEPQKMGGAKTQESLKEFNPLFTLNYSATHKEHHDLVYVLDAVDAYQMKLVKRIEVKGFEIKNLRGTDGYMFLSGIILAKDKPPMARLEFEISYNKSINRETRIVGVGDDLYALSKFMEQYKGYVINEVNPFTNKITFTNGVEISVGEVLGDVAEKDIRRIQIRETIRSHFEKERELFRKGIKTLSLFFIDKVENYRKYNDAGEEVNSEYGDMFEEEYNGILSENLKLDLDPADRPYMKYLAGIDTHATHAGYFSIDKKGHKVDSHVGRGSDISDDESAYDLILKDKEKLLSLDNPVRFIFSHSALREGWDNPNVFQICTLKHGGDSSTNKRQEVGRGLRICVNQQGDRMDESVLGPSVQDVNLLTVIASEGYKDFVASLQKEVQSELYERPTKISIGYFTDKRFEVNGEIHAITAKEDRVIYNYLIKHDYIDDDGKVTDIYRAAVQTKQIAELPEVVRELEPIVHPMIQRVYNPDVDIPGMIGNAHQPVIKENKLNENFYRKEFQKLWNYINHKYTYTVEFDSNELIRKAVESIDKNLFVSHLQYTVTKGKQGEDWSTDKVKEGSGFMAEKSKTYQVGGISGSQVEYDLIGKVREGTHLTRKTVAKILGQISAPKFNLFRENPEEFIVKVSRLINEQKATMIVNDITYNETDDTYDSEIFTAEKNKDFTKAYQGKKSVQDYVFTDGYAEQSVERKFAENMDLDEKVLVYAKLPRGFQIPTPVGNYAPDWAIVFKKGTVKHIYFVAETKGTMESLNLKPIEQAKISCAKKLFSKLSSKDVVYHEVDTYQHLMDIMNQL